MVQKTLSVLLVLSSFGALCAMQRDVELKQVLKGDITFHNMTQATVDIKLYSDLTGKDEATETIFRNNNIQKDVQVEPNQQQAVQSYVNFGGSTWGPTIRVWLKWKEQKHYFSGQEITQTGLWRIKENEDGVPALEK